MPKTSDNENIPALLDALRRRMEDLFILEASIAGIGGHHIRKMLGIEMARVTKVSRHVKKKERIREP